MVGRTTSIVTITGAIVEFVQNNSNNTTATVGSARIILIIGLIIFFAIKDFSVNTAKINARINDIINAIKLLRIVDKNAM